MEKNDKYNPYEWQGKANSQVEGSYKAFGFSTLGLIIMIIILIIFY